MKSFLVSLGGQAYIANQPANVMITIPTASSRFEIVDTQFVTGKEYDQTRFVCRRTAESLVEKYPDMWRIE